MHIEFQQAIEKHRQRVVTLARYSLRSAADADDIAQEVFVKLWQHWPKIDHDKQLPWLLRVTHNAIIDFVRRRKTRNESIDDAVDVEAQAAEQSQFEALENNQLTASLTDAIRQLDDPFRSILVMRDVQGLSYADIEESLDMNASQVKVYLHRARRKLRADPQLRLRFEEINSSGDDVV